MGLDIVVGILCAPEKTEEDSELVEGLIKQVNALLVANALKSHVEPRSGSHADFDMYGYYGLHYLRRIAAHVEMHGELPQPGPSDCDQLGQCDEAALKTYNLAFDDSRKKKRRFFSPLMRFRPTPKKRAFDHLMIHSDCEGFYIPQEFEAVLVGAPPHEVPGGYVGSSHKLRDECQRLAQLLGAPPHLDSLSDEFEEALESQGLSESEAPGVPKWRRYAIESVTCAQLLQAAELSIKTGAAIVFT